MAAYYNPTAAPAVQTQAPSTPQPAKPKPTVPPVPGATPAPAAPGAAPTLADPFGGKGVWTGTGWLPASHPGAQAAGGLPPGSSASTSYARSQVPQGMGATSTTPSAAGGQTIQTQFRDALLGQLGTDPNNVSLTDPDLAPQARAFQNAQQRSQERAQQELAEQGFAGGALGTGAYGAELGAMEQARGESEAQFNADLLTNAKTQRTQNLFNALGLGQQQILGDEAGRREWDLGNANIKLGQSDLALREKLGKGQLSLGLLEALLGDRRANNSLGLQAALGTAGFNRDATLTALGK